MVQYDLKTMQSPRMSGWKLSLFAWVLRLPIIGSFLSVLVKRKNKVHDMVRFTSTLSNLPLYYPIHEMTEEEQERHESMARSSPLSISDLIAAQEHKNEEEQQHKVNFKHWTIHDYVSRYLNKSVTPTQVIEQLIKQIEGVNERNPIVIHMNPESLRKQAAESTARYAKDAVKGELDGVPILVKDEIATIGFPVTMGTSFMSNHVDEDPSPIAKLKQLGVLIVGKTNQHELGIGTTGSNVLHGTPRNPYNTEHFTGGSSSGSAAAVAMGLVPIALGADGGGSVRIPAGLCGCVGVKPTFKRISFDCDLAPSVAHFGLMAGSLSDAAIAYAAMAGRSETDWRNQSWKQPPVHLNGFIGKKKSERSIKGLRMGVFWQHIEDAEENVVTATKDAIEFFRRQGVEIVDIDLPFLQELHLAHGVNILTEMSLFMDHHWRDHSCDLTGESICSLSYGRSFTGREFLAAQKMRGFAMRQIEELFRTKIDIIVSPATPCLAPKIRRDAIPRGESDITQTTTLMRYVIHGNMTGIPGLVFPIGYDEETALPISLQIQAAHWREDLLFLVAREAESILSKGWNKPSEYVDVLGPMVIDPCKMNETKKNK